MSLTSQLVGIREKRTFTLQDTRSDRPQVPVAGEAETQDQENNEALPQ